MFVALPAAAGLMGACEALPKKRPKHRVAIAQWTVQTLRILLMKKPFYSGCVFIY